jgi:hypothetical protein
LPEGYAQIGARSFLLNDPAEATVSPLDQQRKPPATAHPMNLPGHLVPEIFLTALKGSGNAITGYFDQKPNDSDGQRCKKG